MASAGFVLFAMMIAPGLANAAPVCEARSGAATRPLLELYTSEGCSSCPPADQWFARLAGKAEAQELNLLAFHVDYWDAIGWPDRFAQHAFTERQSRRVRAGGSTTIYTPQLMLSSRLDLRWYQPEQVSAALAEVRRRPAELALHVHARQTADHWQVELEATPAAGFAPSSRMYLALYENSVSSKVHAGENAGVTLHHERLVRGLWGPWPLAAAGTARRLQITAPKNAVPAQLGLTAFVQEERAGTTLQALSLPLGPCSLPAPQSPVP